MQGRYKHRGCQKPPKCWNMHILAKSSMCTRSSNFPAYVAAARRQYNGNIRAFEPCATRLGFPHFATPPVLVNKASLDLTFSSVLFQPLQMCPAGARPGILETVLRSSQPTQKHKPVLQVDARLACLLVHPALFQQQFNVLCLKCRHVEGSMVAHIRFKIRNDEVTYPEITKDTPSNNEREGTFPRWKLKRDGLQPVTEQNHALDVIQLKLQAELSSSKEHGPVLQFGCVVSAPWRRKDQVDLTECRKQRQHGSLDCRWSTASSRLPRAARLPRATSRNETSCPFQATAIPRAKALVCPPKGELT